MAFTLVEKHNVSLTHPKHPDAVFVLALPLDAGDFEKLNPETVNNRASLNLDLLAASLVGWPVDAPITRDTIRKLDPDTYTWLIGEVQRASNIEDDEKNESSSGSSPSTDPGEARSPVSLRSSSKRSGSVSTA